MANMAGQVCGARTGALAAQCMFLRISMEDSWMVAFKSPKERNIAITLIRSWAEENYEGPLTGPT